MLNIKRVVVGMLKANCYIVENDDTEYFVFPKSSPLYNELVRKVKSMDSWIPDRYSYRTIKGWVHKELKYVHIDESLF